MTAAQAQSAQHAQLKVQVAQAGEVAAPEREHAARRVAVLVCHGMGQQVQFETLDGVAREVFSAAKSCGTAASEGVTVSLHADEDRFIPRAELQLKHADGTPVDVHFYEAYWAPLTEGRITVRETLAFLLQAGWRGMRFAYRDGVFDRRMFGHRQGFQIPARRVLQLGLALWMLLLISLSFTTAGLIPVAKFADLFRADRADPEIALLASVSFSITAFIVLFGLLLLLVARVLGVGPDTARPKSALDEDVGSLAQPKWKRRFWAVVLIVVIGATAFPIWLIGNLMYAQWLLPVVTAPRAHLPGLVVAALVFVIQGIVLLRFVQSFLLQFGGDVAAYISPYKVSKFEEIRRAIQERGRRVARFIYAAGSHSASSARYDEVLVVGHSLGSLVAYDTLNDAINRDAHQDGWSRGSPKGAYEVVRRTKLLLTFGSPLDKTAFVFRTQKTEAAVNVREALAAALQPLILTYSNRQTRWINLWSRFDWISGPLGYYDAPQPPPERTVQNIERVGSKFPGTAHTEYWTGPLVRGVLHVALTGTCPGDVREPQRSQILQALGAA